MHVSEVIADLLAEQVALDDIVASLKAEQWSTNTASPRWDVTDQIAHLTYFDHRAAQAISDPEGFQIEASRLFSVAGSGVEDGDELTLHEVRDLPIGKRLET